MDLPVKHFFNNFFNNLDLIIFVGRTMDIPTLIYPLILTGTNLRSKKNLKYLVLCFIYDS